MLATHLWRQWWQPERERAAGEQPLEAGEGCVGPAGELELRGLVATAAAESERHRLVCSVEQSEHRLGRVGGEDDHRAGAALVAPVARAQAPAAEEVVVGGEPGGVVGAAAGAVDLYQQVDHRALATRLALQLDGQVGLERGRGVELLAVHA